MANVLRSEKQEQVRALGRLGWSLRRIEEATGVRRETASGYLKAAQIEIRRPRGRKVIRADPGTEAANESRVNSAEVSKAASRATPDSGADSKAASQPTPDLERDPKPSWSPRVSSCEAYREPIETWLTRGRTASAIWQDLVDDHGFEAGYQSVKRFAKKLSNSASVRDSHPRIHTKPGEEAQVDYGGDGPLVRNPNTGKYQRVRLFVMTLGFSRKSIWLLTRKSSSQI